MASAINEFGKFDPLVVEYDLEGVVATTAGAVGSFTNPFEFDVIILFAVLRTTTPSTGAATLDIGVHATGGSSDILFDGVAVGTAAKVAHSAVANGTNGTGAAVWAEGSEVTVTGAADSSGLVGKLILVCRPA